MDITLIILLALIIGIETGAQYFIQKNTQYKDNIYLLIGIVLYGLVGLIYYNILKLGKKLAIANTLWNAGTEITIAILGFILFKQTLTYKQIIAIILIVIAMNYL